MANGFATIIKGLIFGVIFLIIWQIAKINIGIWGIVIFFAIILLAILLSVSSLTSKLPKISMNVRTIIGVILAIAVIIVLLISVIEAAFFAVALLSEDFSDDTTSQDYWYDGNFSIADESLRIHGETVVFNNETSNDFFGTYYNEHPDFKIIGKGTGTIKVVMDNGNQTYEKEVSVDGPFEIKFGTCSEIEREVNAVYVILNDISLTADKDPIILMTDHQVSVIVYFSGSFVVTKMNLEA